MASRKRQHESSPEEPASPSGSMEERRNPMIMGLALPILETIQLEQQMLLFDLMDVDPPRTSSIARISDFLADIEFEIECQTNRRSEAKENASVPEKGEKQTATQTPGTRSTTDSGSSTPVNDTASRKGTRGPISGRIKKTAANRVSRRGSTMRRWREQHSESSPSSEEHSESTPRRRKYPAPRRALPYPDDERPSTSTGLPGLNLTYLNLSIGDTTTTSTTDEDGTPKKG